MNKGQKRNCIQEISKYKDLEGKTKKKETGSIYICQERSRKKHIEDISEYNKIFLKNVFQKEIVKFESENINQKEKKYI